MGVGPALPWGTSIKDAFKRLALPIAGAVLATLLSTRMWCDGFTPLSFAVSGFALVTTLRELVEPAAHQRRNLKAGTALWTTWRRHVGAPVVMWYIGVIMIAVAVTGSGAFKDLSEVTLKEGQVVRDSEYRLTYTGKETVTEVSSSI